MKLKKTAIIIISVLIQLSLIFLWVSLILESIVPVYKWNYNLTLIRETTFASVTVSAPARVETIFTSSTEKANNRRFSSSCCTILSSFVETNNINVAPKCKIVKNNNECLIFEISADGAAEKWIVSTCFGNENSFESSICRSGGNQE